MLGEIVDITHGDQTCEAPVVIDEQQLLNAAAIQNRLGKRWRCVSRRSHQFVLGHHVLDARLGGMIDKANVAPSQDANHSGASRAVFGNRKSTNAVFTHQLLRALHGVCGCKRDGIGDDAVLSSLDFLNFERLPLRRNIFVDDVSSWLKTIHEEARKVDDSATVRVWLDELNDLFCVAIVDASGCAECCVASPRTPSTKEEQLILSVINGGPEAEEAFRNTVVKMMGDHDKKPAKTESDKREEHIADSVTDEDMTDEEIDSMASKLDKTASLLANNQSAAYMVELAASRLREIKLGE